MINKQPSYSSIQEWANKLHDYELDNVWFSVTQKPRVKLKATSMFGYAVYRWLEPGETESVLIMDYNYVVKS